MNIKNKLIPEIQERYSPRNFKDKKVEKEKLDLILEAARWAPSGFNNQPWRYIVVEKSSKSRVKLENSLMPGNGWAKDAPVLLVCYTNKNLQKSANNVPYHVYDSALSVMSLCIQAENVGLKTHQMGGFFASKVRKSLSIPEDYDILVVIAIGYEEKKMGIIKKTAEGIKDFIFKPRKRKEINEIVSYDYFKN